VPVKNLRQGFSSVVESIVSCGSGNALVLGVLFTKLLDGSLSQRLELTYPLVAENDPSGGYRENAAKGPGVNGLRNGSSGFLTSPR
jgi:hypothetical protein